MPAATLDSIRARIGEESRSGWLVVDQDRVNAFAAATDDHQFIHVDPEAAAASPLGGTVAHGFLTLALLPRMAAEAMLFPIGLKMMINYGFERVRFIAPVRCGKRIRGRFRLDSVEEREPGQWLVRHDLTVDIEDEPRPALHAAWLGLLIV